MAQPAFAAHPLASEDTGTQGEGSFELEIGWQRVREDAARTMELGPQLSYGVTDALDVILRPTALDLRGADEGGRARGVGDTAVGFKWRAIDTEPVSGGLRADVIVPTGSRARGLGAGSAGYHVVGIVTALVNDDWRVHANLAYNRVPAATGVRRNLASGSLTAVWSATDALRISVELIATSPLTVEERRWAYASRIGVIAAVASCLDIDVGYQVRLDRVGPQAIALAGATLRW